MKFTKKEELEYCELLESKGYIKFKGHYKSEDYGYWKSFEYYEDSDGERRFEYQIAILFFDFGKYPNYKGEKPIGTQFEYIGNTEEYISRLDFYASDDYVGVDEFEKMANHFYHQMIIGYVKKNFKKNIEE